MANNRLYILDAETGEKLLIAKSIGDGWRLFFSGDDTATDVIDRIDAWFAMRDAAASYGNAQGTSKLRLVTENDE